MLRLKRIEIHGFKSFCDRTELRFQGAGLAAIVGPNGCGKSNLSDAISWVLGEQSAKTLRGTRMEDVIFAGTPERKPVGMASVTMTLVDPDQLEDGPGTAGSSSTPGGNGRRTPREVTITRRLFRSGESEYLVDGRLARLRDIQDIFMGTGLGPDTYAIIEQGRIGQILSSKPQDRRAVIEEAAGVSKFKAKRRLAEAKLEGARQNLSRVFDILEEVGRQANSLKRQAAKARRYEELKKEMLAHLERALTGRFRLLERDAARIAIDLNLAASRAQALAAEVAEAEQGYSNLQQQCHRVERELTEARSRLAELRLDAERTRGRLEAQAREIASMEQRLAKGESETQEAEQQYIQLQTQVRAAVEALERLEAEAELARRLLEEKNARRERVQSSLRSEEQAIEEARRQVLRLLNEGSALKNQLAKIDEFLAGLDRDRVTAGREEEGARADLERLFAVRDQLGGRIAVGLSELEATRSARQATEERLSAVKKRAAEARREMEELRAETLRIKGRKESLQEILSHRAYTTEAVKRLFTAIEHGEAQELRPLGVVADFVEVEPSLEKATEAFLHDELEYVVVADWAQAESGVQLMRTELEGRATFLVHPEPEGAFEERPDLEPAIGPETGLTGRLADHLRFTNGLTQAPAELLPRLARCFLAEDRSSAQRLALQYPAFYFLLPDGVCYHGRTVTGGRKSASGPLALKRELRELASLLTTKTKSLEAVSTEVAGLEREIGSLDEELERLRTLQQSQEKASLALEHEMRKLEEEAARASRRLSLARLELGRLHLERQKAEAERTETLSRVEGTEQSRRVQEEKLEETRRRVEELQAEAALLGEDHSSMRAALAGLEERCRSARTAKAGLEQQLRDLADRRDALAAELERLGVERARLLGDNIQLDERAAALDREISAAEQSAGELAQDEQRLRDEVAGIEERLREMRTALEEARERRSQVEVELVRRQSELKYLDETCRKELGRPIAQTGLEEETVPDEEALAEAEQRYQAVKERIEALGPVNPQALEEYQEAQQRYDFLNAQRQDLLDSIRDTERAIHEIDTESRRRFQEAFTAINRHFQDTFRALFGGGTGQMRLTDESNIQESGIDIVASPPGKRLQNVLLLSGGEKALTALALLIAIFRYQPSPFFVLDEVDAPLDEPNIERLVKLLNEMSAQTQFILITHAKRTMEAAQVLYGVTMQEPGVSKLVSVRFRAAGGNGNGSNGQGAAKGAAV